MSSMKMVYMHGHSVHPNMFKHLSRMWRHTWIHKTASDGKKPSKTDTPLTTTYRPELDVSRELHVDDAAYYQSLLGILRWIVELG